MKRSGSDETLRCSFCHKSQDVVGKLISSPSDYPRAYICDECIAVCNSILEDDRTEPASTTPNKLPKPLVRRIIFQGQLKRTLENRNIILLNLYPDGTLDDQNDEEKNDGTLEERDSFYQTGVVHSGLTEW